MGRPSKKKYQLFVVAESYCEECRKISEITKEELEKLFPLFTAISNNPDRENNWSQNEVCMNNPFGDFLPYLMNEAFVYEYTEFCKNKEVQALTMKFFPNQGKCSNIIKIDVQEVKTINSFL